MPKIPFAPFWTTADRTTLRFHLGHVTDVLARLPERSVHCVVTSPPYWGLRDYGTDKTLEIGSEPSPDCNTHGQAQCGGCFVCSMVAVFRGVRRVLRDDGTVWLNLGDTYSGGGRGDAGGQGTSSGKQISNGGTAGRSRAKTVIPSGNLVGVPWRVALALQADGWVLRQDVIWHKPSPMPESVRNRCTKAHEYVFLLTKSMRYFYDAEAAKEKASNGSGGWQSATKKGLLKPHGDSETCQDGDVTGLGGVGLCGVDRNKRSVWTVSSQGYEGAHFATFPPKLITPMIKAGTSEHGCCASCGAPWERLLEERKLVRERPNDYVKRTGEEGTGNSCANSVAGVETRTVGWEPTCGCVAGVEPCVVLDPFVGSGTTAEVCIDLGRRCWGIDLSEKYLTNNAVPRVTGAILSRPALRALLPREGGRVGVVGGTSVKIH